jgi:hypothetical protein
VATSARLERIAILSFEIQSRSWVAAFATKRFMNSRKSSTVREALEMIEGTSLDAALLDANLHGQSVDQIAAALTRYTVPFLFVTGCERATLPKAFANAATRKSFSRQELIHAAVAMMAPPVEVYCSLGNKANVASAQRMSAIGTLKTCDGHRDVCLSG